MWKIEAIHLFHDGGVDHEDRKVVVFSACHLPDPNEINYDIILEESFVEDDYVMVFFSSPAHYKPSWIWLLKAYRELHHGFKKNLKALYVLHMSKSYRIVFNFANKIISPKFASKITYLSTLDELDKVIDLSHMRIPHEVVEHELALPHSLFSYHHHYYHNQFQQLHHQSQNHHYHPHHHHHYQVSQKSDRPRGHFVFGRDLEDLAELKGYELSDTKAYIPSVVRKLVEHVQTAGIQQEGIFRKSPSNTDLSKARDNLDEGIHRNVLLTLNTNNTQSDKNMDIQNMDIQQLDVHTTASLLKMFLAGLPGPLLSSEFAEEHYNNKDTNEMKIKLMEHYKDRPHHFALLKYLIDFLAQVSENSETNKMTLHNLAVVFAPSLIRSTVPFNNILTNPSDAAIYLKQVKQHMSFIEFLISERESLMNQK